MYYSKVIFAVVEGSNKSRNSSNSLRGRRKKGRGGGEKHERGERKRKGAAAIRAGVFVICLAQFSELIR